MFLMDRTTSSEAPQAFPPTRWSVVLAAKQPESPESAVALETLCRSYWYPLYAFVRRRGCAPHDAEDLVQEFFRRLLEKRWLAPVAPEKGRLRTFLIVAMKRLMAQEWRRASAQRRGSGQPPLPLDTQSAESRYAIEETAQFAEEAVFDREWALTVIDLSLNRLREEFAAAGNPDRFEALKGCLTAARGTIDYASVAERLGTDEVTARVAVHRFRKRFREVFRNQILQTLPDGSDLDAEIRHLAAALAQG
jgi:RNA polymerase sigma factor (sigma-70 family)